MTSTTVTPPATLNRSKKPSLFNRLFTRYVNHRFSKQFKRMIFLASVVGLLENIHSPDKAMLAKLNEVLKLAHHNDAIAFPILIHSYLWKNCDMDTRLPVNGESVPLSKLSGSHMTLSHYRALARYLMLSSPKWMIYGSENQIAEDLEMLFKHMPNLMA